MRHTRSCLAGKARPALRSSAEMAARLLRSAHYHRHFKCKYSSLFDSSFHLFCWECPGGSISHTAMRTDIGQPLAHRQPKTPLLVQPKHNLPLPATTREPAPGPFPALADYLL